MKQKIVELTEKLAELNQANDKASQDRKELMATIKSLEDQILQAKGRLATSQGDYKRALITEKATTPPAIPIAVSTGDSTLVPAVKPAVKSSDKSPKKRRFLKRAQKNI